MNTRPRSSSGAAALDEQRIAHDGDAVAEAADEHSGHRERERRRHRRDPEAERHQRDRAGVAGPRPESIEQRGRRDAADRQAETRRSDEQAEAHVSRIERDLREHHLADVDGGVAEKDDVPDDEDGEERSRAEHEADPVAEVLPVARLSIVPAWSRCAGILKRRTAEIRNETAFSQYASSGPCAAISTPPSTGPIIQVRFSAACRIELAFGRSVVRRRGSASRHTPPAGRSRWRSRRAPRGRRSRPRSLRTATRRRPRRARDRSATSRRRLEKRSTSGPSSSPITMIGRKSAIRSALTHVPDPVRSKTSTVSASAARYVPAPEPSVASRSRR